MNKIVDDSELLKEVTGGKKPRVAPMTGSTTQEVEVPTSTKQVAPVTAKPEQSVVKPEIKGTTPKVTPKGAMPVLDAGQEQPQKASFTEKPVANIDMSMPELQELEIKKQKDLLGTAKAVAEGFFTGIKAPEGQKVYIDDRHYVLATDKDVKEFEYYQQTRQNSYTAPGTTPGYAPYGVQGQEQESYSTLSDYMTKKLKKEVYLADEAKPAILLELGDMSVEERIAWFNENGDSNLTYKERETEKLLQELVNTGQYGLTAEQANEMLNEIGTMEVLDLENGYFEVSDKTIERLQKDEKFLIDYTTAKNAGNEALAKDILIKAVGDEALPIVTNNVWLGGVINQPIRVGEKVDPGATDVWNKYWDGFQNALEDWGFGDDMNVNVPGRGEMNMSITRVFNNIGLTVNNFLGKAFKDMTQATLNTSADMIQQMGSPGKEVNKVRYAMDGNEFIKAVDDAIKATDSLLIKNQEKSLERAKALEYKYALYTNEGFFGLPFEFADELGYTAGYMAPTMATAIASGGLGLPAQAISLTTMGIGVAQRTYQENIANGVDYKTAMAHALLTAGVEVATETWLGDAIDGIKFTGNPLKGETVTKTIKNILMSAVEDVNHPLRLLTEVAQNMFNEGAEEFVAEILGQGLNNMLQYKLLSGESEVDMGQFLIEVLSDMSNMDTFGKAGNSFMLGAVSGGIMSGSQLIASKAVMAPFSVPDARMKEIVSVTGNALTKLGIVDEFYSGGVVAFAKDGADTVYYNFKDSDTGIEELSDKIDEMVAQGYAPELGVFGNFEVTGGKRVLSTSEYGLYENQDGDGPKYKIVKSPDNLVQAFAHEMVHAFWNPKESTDPYVKGVLDTFYTLFGSFDNQRYKKIQGVNYITVDGQIGFRVGANSFMENGVSQLPSGVKAGDFIALGSIEHAILAKRRQSVSYHRQSGDYIYNDDYRIREELVADFIANIVMTRPDLLLRLFTTEYKKGNVRVANWFKDKLTNLMASFGTDLTSKFAKNGGVGLVAKALDHVMLASQFNASSGTFYSDLAKSIMESQELPIAQQAYEKTIGFTRTLTGRELVDTTKTAQVQKASAKNPIYLSAIGIVSDKAETEYLRYGFMASDIVDQDNYNELDRVLLGEGIEVEDAVSLNRVMNRAVNLVSKISDTESKVKNYLLTPKVEVVTKDGASVVSVKMLADASLAMFVSDVAKELDIRDTLNGTILKSSDAFPKPEAGPVPMDVVSDYTSVTGRKFSNASQKASNGLMVDIASRVSSIKSMTNDPDVSKLSDTLDKIAKKQDALIRSGKTIERADVKTLKEMLESLDSQDDSVFKTIRNYTNENIEGEVNSFRDEISRILDAKKDKKLYRSLSYSEVERTYDDGIESGSHTVLFDDSLHPGYYSKIRNMIIERMPKKATVQEIKAIVKSASKYEYKTFLEPLLVKNDDNAILEKDVVLEFMYRNEPILDVDFVSNTYGNWMLRKQNINYQSDFETDEGLPVVNKAILMRVYSNNFTSNDLRTHHFDDEVLSHVLVSEMFNVDGASNYLLEESQSDTLQEMETKGLKPKYAVSEGNETLLKDYTNEIKAKETLLNEIAFEKNPTENAESPVMEIKNMGGVLFAYGAEGVVEKLDKSRASGTWGFSDEEIAKDFLVRGLQDKVKRINATHNNRNLFVKDVSELPQWLSETDYLNNAFNGLRHSTSSRVFSEEKSKTVEYDEIYHQIGRVVTSNTLETLRKMDGKDPAPIPIQDYTYSSDSFKDFMMRKYGLNIDITIINKRDVMENLTRNGFVATDEIQEKIISDALMSAVIFGQPSEGLDVINKYKIKDESGQYYFDQKAIKENWKPLKYRSEGKTKEIKTFEDMLKYVPSFSETFSQGTLPVSIYTSGKNYVTEFGTQIARSITQIEALEPTVDDLNYFPLTETQRVVADGKMNKTPVISRKEIDFGTRSTPVEREFIVGLENVDGKPVVKKFKGMFRSFIRNINVKSVYERHSVIDMVIISSFEGDDVVDPFTIVEPVTYIVRNDSDSFTDYEKKAYNPLNIMNLVMEGREKGINPEGFKFRHRVASFVNSGRFYSNRLMALSKTESPVEFLNKVRSINQYAESFINKYRDIDSRIIDSKKGIVPLPFMGKAWEVNNINMLMKQAVKDGKERVYFNTAFTLGMRWGDDKLGDVYDSYSVKMIAKSVPYKMSADSGKSYVTTEERLHQITPNSGSQTTERYIKGMLSLVAKKIAGQAFSGISFEDIPQLSIDEITQRLAVKSAKESAFRKATEMAKNGEITKAKVRETADALEAQEVEYFKSSRSIKTKAIEQYYDNQRAIQSNNLLKGIIDDGLYYSVVDTIMTPDTLYGYSFEMLLEGKATVGIEVANSIKYTLFDDGRYLNNGDTSMLEAQIELLRDVFFTKSGEVRPYEKLSDEQIALFGTIQDYVSFRDVVVQFLQPLGKVAKTAHALNELMKVIAEGRYNKNIVETPTKSSEDRSLESIAKDIYGNPYKARMYESDFGDVFSITDNPIVPYGSRYDGFKLHYDNTIYNEIRKISERTGARYGFEFVANKPIGNFADARRYLESILKLSILPLTVNVYNDLVGTGVLEVASTYRDFLQKSDFSQGIPVDDDMGEFIVGDRLIDLGESIIDGGLMSRYMTTTTKQRRKGSVESSELYKIILNDELTGFSYLLPKQNYGKVTQTAIGRESNEYDKISLAGDFIRVFTSAIVVDDADIGFNLEKANILAKIALQNHYTDEAIEDYKGASMSDNYLETLEYMTRSTLRNVSNYSGALRKTVVRQMFRPFVEIFIEGTLANGKDGNPLFTTFMIDEGFYEFMYDIAKVYVSTDFDSYIDGMEDELYKRVRSKLTPVLSEITKELLDFRTGKGKLSENGADGYISRVVGAIFEAIETSVDKVMGNSLLEQGANFTETSVYKSTLPQIALIAKRMANMKMVRDVGDEIVGVAPIYFFEDSDAIMPEDKVYSVDAFTSPDGPLESLRTDTERLKYLIDFETKSFRVMRELSYRIERKIKDFNQSREDAPFYGFFVNREFKNEGYKSFMKGQSEQGIPEHILRNLLSDDNVIRDSAFIESDLTDEQQEFLSRKFQSVNISFYDTVYQNYDVTSLERYRSQINEVVKFISMFNSFRESYNSDIIQSGQLKDMIEKLNENPESVGGLNYLATNGIYKMMFLDINDKVRDEFSSDKKFQLYKRYDDEADIDNYFKPVRLPFAVDDLDKMLQRRKTIMPVDELKARFTWRKGMGFFDVYFDGKTEVNLDEMKEYVNKHTDPKSPERGLAVQMYSTFTSPKVLAGTIPAMTLRGLLKSSPFLYEQATWSGILDVVNEIYANNQNAMVEINAIKELYKNIPTLSVESRTTADEFGQYPQYYGYSTTSKVDINNFYTGNKMNLKEGGEYVEDVFMANIESVNPLYALKDLHFSKYDNVIGEMRYTIGATHDSFEADFGNESVFVLEEIQSLYASHKTAKKGTQSEQEAIEFAKTYNNIFDRFRQDMAEHYDETIPGDTKAIVFDGGDQYYDKSILDYVKSEYGNRATIVSNDIVNEENGARFITSIVKIGDSEVTINSVEFDDRKSLINYMDYKLMSDLTSTLPAQTAHEQEGRQAVKYPTAITDRNMTELANAMYFMDYSVINLPYSSSDLFDSIALKRAFKTALDKGATRFYIASGIEQADRYKHTPKGVHEVMATSAVIKVSGDTLNIKLNTTVRENGQYENKTRDMSFNAVNFVTRQNATVATNLEQDLNDNYRTMINVWMLKDAFTPSEMNAIKGYVKRRIAGKVDLLTPETLELDFVRDNSYHTKSVVEESDFINTTEGAVLSQMMTNLGVKTEMGKIAEMIIRTNDNKVAYKKYKSGQFYNFNAINKDVPVGLIRGELMSTRFWQFTEIYDNNLVTKVMKEFGIFGVTPTMRFVAIDLEPKFNALIQTIIESDESVEIRDQIKELSFSPTGFVRFSEIMDIVNNGDYSAWFRHKIDELEVFNREVTQYMDKAIGQDQYGDHLYDYAKGLAHGTMMIEVPLTPEMKASYKVYKAVSEEEVETMNEKVERVNYAVPPARLPLDATEEQIKATKEELNQFKTLLFSVAKGGHFVAKMPKNAVDYYAQLSAETKKPMGDLFKAETITNVWESGVYPNVKTDAGVTKAMVINSGKLSEVERLNAIVDMLSISKDVRHPRVPRLVATMILAQSSQFALGDHFIDIELPYAKMFRNVRVTNYQRHRLIPGVDGKYLIEVVYNEFNVPFTLMFVDELRLTEKWKLNTQPELLAMAKNTGQIMAWMSDDFGMANLALLRKSQKNFYDVGNFKKHDEARATADEWETLFDDANPDVKRRDIKGMKGSYVKITSLKKAYDYDQLEPKQRKHVTTVMESGEIEKKTKTTLESQLRKGLFDYIPSSDKDALAYAREVILADIDQAYQDFESAFRNNVRMGKKDIAIAEMLIAEMSKPNSGVKNRVSKVVKLIGDLATLGTELGQQVQALSLIKKLSAQGQLLHLERVAQRLTKQYADYGRKVTFVFDGELVEELLQQTDQVEIERVVDKIKLNLSEQIPTTLMDKLDAWRYLSMLGNIRTHIRNIAGNVLMLPLVRIKDTIATMGEMMFIPDDERTKSFTYSKELKDYAKRDFDQNAEQILGGGKYDTATELERNKRVFKWKWLEAMRVGNGNLLEFEDLVFSKIHYVHALAGILNARGINPETATEKELQDARFYAMNEAQKATFRDASWLASTLNHIERSNKVAGFGIKATLPFKKTPTNIVKRGAEYSAIGLLTGVTINAYNLHKEKITPAQFIDKMSAGLTGTGVMLVGYMAYMMGFLTLGADADDSDKEKAFLNAINAQKYSIDLFGQGTYTIDWAVPSALPFIVGAELARYFDETGGKGSLMNVVPEVLVNTFDPIFELTMLDSLKETLQSFSSSGASLAGEAIASMASSYAGQFIPTILGQLARIVDPTRRSTFAPKDSEINPMFETFIRQMMNKVPFLTQFNQPIINVLGEEELYYERGNILQAIFTQMLSPGYFKGYETSDAEDAILTLFNRTMAQEVLPRVTPKTFTLNGSEYVLTPIERTDFAKVMGGTTKELVELYSTSSVYGKMSMEDKIDVYSKIYAYSYSKAKESVAYNTDEWYRKVETARDNMIQPVTYFRAEVAFDKLKATTEKTKEYQYVDVMSEMGLTTQQIVVMLELEGYKVSDKDRAYIEARKGK